MQFGWLQFAEVIEMLLSPHMGAFHMTCTVIIMLYEVTLEKCISVGRTIASTVQPTDKN